MIFIKVFQKIIPALFTLCQFSLSSKKSLLLLLVVSFLIFTCDEEKPVPTTGDITGRVTDQKNQPLPGVLVVLRTQGGTRDLDNRTTPNNGNYDFQEKAAGNYTLIFSKSGYTGDTKEVTVEGGGIGNADIALESFVPVPKLAIKNDDIVMDTLDFDTESTQKLLTISNIGDDGSKLKFTIGKTAKWLTLSSAADSIIKNIDSAPKTIEVKIDRNMIEFIDQTATDRITVGANGSVDSKTIIVKVRQQINLGITPPAPSQRPAVETLRILNHPDSIIAEGRINNVKKGIIEFGFIYSQTITPPPDINSDKMTLGGVPTTGSFSTTLNLADFSSSNANYVRSYAVYSDGMVSYGKILAFKKKIAWEPIADFPDARYRSVAFVLNGQGYVGIGSSGGASGPDIPYEHLQNFYRYNPITNQWKYDNKLDEPRGITTRAHAIAFVINRVAYVGGGLVNGLKDDFINDIYLTHGLSGVWFPSNNPNSLPDKRADAVAFVIDGKAYFGAGAFGTPGDPTQKPSSFYCYDPSTNQGWTRVADFPVDGNGFGAVAFVIKGKGYVGSFDENNEFYRYDPATNHWERIANFPDVTASVGVAFAIDGKGYVGVGAAGRGSRSFYRYDPATDQWEKAANFPDKRRQAVAFVIDGKGYVGLGFVESTMNTFYRYNPSEDIVEIIK